jgi:hypothetical protein
MSEDVTSPPAQRLKRGRPVKADGEGRTLSLPPVRVNAAEAALIDARAAVAGLRLSVYIREAALGHDLAPAPRDIDDKLLFELNRAGVNLHQIVRHLNFGGSIPSDIGDVLAELKAAIARVGAAYDA